MTEKLRALETSFREKVVDKETAYAEMKSVLLQTVCQHALLLVVGPEGVGKTTSLFDIYHRVIASLATRGESRLGMFAFADYDAAETKCRKFNEKQCLNGFHGVVLRSFSRTYQEVCKELGVGQLTVLDAARGGLANLWTAIKRLQPKVIDAFRKRHEEMWESLRGKRLVYFTVHDVMHRWRKSSLTRRIWAPSFWARLEDSDEQAFHEQILKETTLGFAVHDEVKKESIVTTWRDEMGCWVERLVASDSSVWKAGEGALAQRLASYESFLKEEGQPTLDGKALGVSFDEADRIVRNNRSSWDHVITRDSGEYWRPRRDAHEDRVDIYEACHGHKWRVCERGWWDGLAHQTILLTTEAVPSALVRASTSPWSILKLEAPLMPKNFVEVHARRGITGANLPQVCADFRELHPDTFIISNKAKVISDTLPHVTARGSNDLIGKNVMQTMTFVPPQLYEELQVLNAWTGRADLVGLSHVDEFNQSAGRNLGCRWENEAKHTLLVNRSLFKLLSASSALGSCRYIWQLVLDKHQRSDATSH